MASNKNFPVVSNLIVNGSLITHDDNYLRITASTDALLASKIAGLPEDTEKKRSGLLFIWREYVTSKISNGASVQHNGKISAIAGGSNVSHEFVILTSQSQCRNCGRDNGHASWCKPAQKPAQKPEANVEDQFAKKPASQKPTSQPTGKKPTGNKKPTSQPASQPTGKKPEASQPASPEVK